MPTWRTEVTSVTPEALTEDQREALALALPGFSTITDDEMTRSVIIAFDVEARTPREAAARASKALTDAARQALGDVLPFLGIRAGRGDTAPKPAMPELLGYAEIATVLQVSRQRARELAETHPDFPPPVSRLSMGPIFTLESVMDFAKGWERRAGRPRKTA
ncbi:hypothetical protein JOL79_11400 [Microbispora sp. RL4-1S]|uniref:Helix-turn-helix domain-containing protein n=1 Tax=Microbispora oryzae TaxID=2806554 RepID=A0A940WF10_9ACTN|nr:hypothetical protein [Microbispora oryzae]MBP2704419.1 hypothetical protein [Microbispora oryzae]